MHRILLLTVALAVIATGCKVSIGGGDAKSGVEEAITEKAAEQLVGFDVTGTNCPEDASTDEGSTFECTVKVNGQDLTVEVVGEGGTRFSFDQKDAILDLAKAEETFTKQFSEQLGSAVTVSCDPPQIRVIPVGGTVNCTVTDGNGTTAVVEMTVQDADGNVDAQILG